MNVEHMELEAWRCDIGPCGQVIEGKTALQTTSSSPSASDTGEHTEIQQHNFRDKALFTQHVKRMHGPNENASLAERQAFENGIEAAQVRCHQVLRHAPSDTMCTFCQDRIFESWDDRMEHVGRHLEEDYVAVDLQIEDVSLRHWMEAQGLIRWEQSIGWRLVSLDKRGTNNDPGHRRVHLAVGQMGQSDSPQIGLP